MADDITRHRAAIDALDEKIAALLNERANHAASIGKLKANGGAYRPEREAEILRRIAAANRGPLANDALVRLFTEIISASRSPAEPLAGTSPPPPGTSPATPPPTPFLTPTAAHPPPPTPEPSLP